MSLWCKVFVALKSSDFNGLWFQMAFFRYILRIYIYIYIYVTNPGHELCSTHHQMSLFHHRTFHTVTDHSRTTFPIIHCTNTAVCTDHAHTWIQSPNHHHPITHTHYISPGHSPIHCRVLLASYLSKRFPSFLSLFPCVPIPPLPLDYSLWRGWRDVRHSDPNASFLFNIMVNTGRVGQEQTGMA